MATSPELVNLRARAQSAQAEISRLQGVLTQTEQVLAQNQRLSAQFTGERTTQLIRLERGESVPESVQNAVLTRISQGNDAARAAQAQVNTIVNLLTAQQVIISDTDRRIAAIVNQNNAELQRASAQTASDAVNPPATAITQRTGTQTLNTLPLSDDEADALADRQVNTELSASINSIITNVDDAASGQASVASIANIMPPAVPSENVLNSLASYTYGISLHVLDTNDYNNMMTAPGSFRVTKNIISSASRYREERVEQFNDDFYFSDLQMLTIIGLSRNTPATNAVSIKFKLLEPYGLTLMNRLLDLSRTLESKNYLEQPYLLEINFFGYDDSGESKKLSELTKFIPIKLVAINIKAGVRGSEYDVQAIPYGQMAHMQSLQAIKANFEVTAKTVGEFFDKTLSQESQAQVFNSVDTQVQDDQRRTGFQNEVKSLQTNSTQAAAQGEFFDEGQEIDVQVVENKIQNLNSQPTPTVQVSSFAGAYNLWLQHEAEHGYMDTPDVIEFVLDDEIASAMITNPEKSNPRSVGAAVGTKNSETTDTGNSPGIQESTPKQGPDFSRGIRSINAGTSITSVINNAIINSSYITSQMLGTETDRKPVTLAKLLDNDVGGQGVRWFKIVPVIELLGFDAIRNKYAKKITYFVRAFTHYNNSDPRVPKSIPQGAVKQYDYMYTGNNTEVIDFRIEFNTLAYTLINVSRSKTEVLNQSGGVNRNNVYSQQSAQPSGSFQPNQQDYVSGTQHSMVSGAHESSEKSLARGYADSIYSNSGGDMISVSLKILGDPDFIKQDEFLYHPGAVGVGYNSQFLPGTGNSLNMDSGEIFCEVRFRSPVDMDEGTGMMRQDSAYSTSYFSGIYKVISVENDFSRGQFTQSLNLIRYPNQPEDTLPNGQELLGIRAATSASITTQNTDSDSDLEAE